MDIINWKWFRYDEVFDIKKGKRLTLSSQEIGQIPYISSSSVNNGVDNYINNGYTDENCISFACYGSIGEVFYHKGKVWVSDNANVIYLKNKQLNRYIAMFIVSLIYKEKYRFSYGVTGKKERLNFLRIKLPFKFNDDNEAVPDWEYIENHIKEIISSLPIKTKSIWENQFNNKPLSSTKISLNTENWNWFEIKKLFDIYKGHEIINNLLKDGDIPLVSATQLNNGINEMVQYSEEIFEGGVITVASNGKPGISFYQPLDFCATGDVNVLIPKFNSNQYILLFIISVIEKEVYRFSWLTLIFWGLSEKFIKSEKEKLSISNTS